MILLALKTGNSIAAHREGRTTYRMLGVRDTASHFQSSGI